MNQDDRLKDLKQEYENTPIPPKGPPSMEESVKKARRDKDKANKISPFYRCRKAAACVAAAMALCVVLPNVNENIAMAMEKIPIIGGLVRVITFDRYTYQDDHYLADVSVPKLEAEDTPLSGAADTINRSVEEYTNQLIESFKADVAADAGGHEGLDIRYDVVTDSDTWFTLRLTALQTMASGYQQIRYYHIDKTSGKEITLKDLFLEGGDYITPITDNIKTQMREQMKQDEGRLYFLDSDTPELDFKQITPDQNFYWNSDGNLVVVFDEYEAAPGYMGNPEFVIPNEVTDGIWK